jgi:purine-binding chemotaxis protein CheW
MTTALMPTPNKGVTQAALLEGQQFLTFMLGHELYGLDILKVQEIRGWTGVTAIPNAPAHIRGVLNLRGAIVPVLDLRRRFQMEEIPFTPYTVVIVVQIHGRTVGMIVDAVSDVVNLSADKIRPAPDFGTAIDASFLRGLAPVDDKMMILLNAEDVLRASDLMSLPAEAATA